MLREQVVSNEVLSTVLAEVTNILNSRPLSRNSDSLLDEQPLTPNHLLHLRPCPSVPPGVFDKDDLTCRRAWKQAQYLANLFWRRWTREYLPTLLERKKWTEPKRNLQIGACSRRNLFQREVATWKSRGSYCEPRWVGARSEGEDKCNSSDMCQTTVQKRTCDRSQYHHTYTPSCQVMFSGDGWSGR